MGDVKSIDTGRELRERKERIVRGLRVLADQIDEGLEDYDAIPVCGYTEFDDIVTIMPYELSPMQLSWCGRQVMDHAATEHAENYADD